ncbi:Sensor protein [Thermotoga neapolitana DSM 4359]|uniref:Sensor protein n=1 Tax=Thermotoga neapolitana (strain ATCC 49049 / DSM 4359 / NBRC 107923 / NS-E) TaxID=309803 RepID=B9K722_THENN|nr:Sensor protein [Thermotoga neapolitana DSM 4359]
MSELRRQVIPSSVTPSEYLLHVLCRQVPGCYNDNPIQYPVAGFCHLWYVLFFHSKFTQSLVQPEHLLEVSEFFDGEFSGFSVVCFVHPEHFSSNDGESFIGVVEYVLEQIRSRDAQSKTVRDLRVKSTETVFKRVVCDDTGQCFCDTCFGACPGKVRSGFHVLSVFVSDRKIRHDPLHGIQSENVRVRICVHVQEGLYGVVERIHRSVSGLIFGKGLHHLRIHQGKNGEGVSVADTHLFFRFGVCDHGEWVGFRSRSMGGRNGNNGDGLFRDLSPSHGNVVPEFSFVWSGDGDRLCTVYGASTTKSHDEIYLFFSHDLCGFIHMIRYRVGNDLVENDAFNACFFEKILYSLEKTRFFRAGPSSDDQRFLSQFLRPLFQFIYCTHSEDYFCWKIT